MNDAEKSMLESTTEGGGGWKKPLYKPYRYVPPQRVWFLDLFRLKTAVNFSLESTMVYEGTTGAYERTYRRHIKFCKQNTAMPIVLREN